LKLRNLSTGRRRRCRRLTILDVMILVAGSALGFALARTLVSDSTSLRILLSRPAPFFLLGLTLAYLPIRLKQPRPPLRRLIVQPGMAACLAVSIVVVIDAISWGIFWARLKSGDATNMVARFWRLSHEHPGPAVLAVWLGLILSRRWRPEPGWIDRFGRLIGVLWLLTLLSDWEYVRGIQILIDRLMRANP
jgi:hypothetical protein